MQIVQISKTKLKSFRTLHTENSRRPALVKYLHLQSMQALTAPSFRGGNVHKDSTMTLTHIVKQQIQCADESTVALLH